ncbi:MAG TPA: menaquinone biosynthesis protein [Acidobacteriota bacterium]|nr:menaquinone biosynthesis protein [Acidobacteriota bacterium]
MLRVSFIDFLNAVPLGWDFLYGSSQRAFEILYDVPSQCARHMETGEADVGLIPVIEYQRIAGLRILSDISIASQREARSVLFASRMPIRQVRSVALDPSSRTSVALLKILFQKSYQNSDVRYFSGPPDAVRIPEGADAALLIGNPALRLRREGLHVYDLANEWFRWTGLPFVFAFWAVRSGVSMSRTDKERFYRSRQAGLENVEEIARIYSERLQIDRPEIVRYLTRNLDFHLDGRNLQGLTHFYRLAAECGLIDEVRQPEFV